MLLRVQSGNKLGTTGFFRNRPLLEAMVECLQGLGKPTVRVLFHASSIGAEVYSFLIHATLTLGQRPGPKIKCFASDIEAGFLDRAREGIFPIDVLSRLRGEERLFFKVLNKKLIRVHDPIREAVSFLPPADFVTFAASDDFDMVVVLDALLHVVADDQARAIAAIARYNSGFLVASGFHMDRIKADVTAAGYHPVVARIEHIHKGWKDRLALPRGYVVPGVTHHSPALPPFAIVADFEYKFCALFAKEGVPHALATDEVYADLLAS